MEESKLRKIVREKLISLNESREFVIIDPRGNARPVGSKIQASQYTKKMGGPRKGWHIVLKKNALKARRAIEKNRGNATNSKIQDIMFDLMYEGKLNEAKTFKVGDMWSSDFDYRGMMEYGSKVKDLKPILLQKLYDSLEDVNYHSENKALGLAIDALESGNKNAAKAHLKTFNKLCLKTLKSFKEGVNESRIHVKEAGFKHAFKKEIKPEDLAKWAKKAGEGAECTIAKLQYIKIGGKWRLLKKRQTYFAGTETAEEMQQTAVERANSGINYGNDNKVTVSEGVLNEVTAKDTLTNAVNALTKTIGGKKLNNKYVKGYLKSIERIARKNPGGFVKDYGEFDVSDWIEDVRYNLQNEYKK